MSTIDEEITGLTDKWYSYVNLDHHKDRDCHFYIEKTWSYGEQPTYHAYHEGYVADRFTGPERETSYEAHLDLLGFISGEVDKAIEGAKNSVGDPYSGADAKKTLEIFEEDSK